MTLKQKLRKDLRTAFQSGDDKKHAVIKMLLSELNYAELASHSSQEIDDHTATAMILNYYKRLSARIDRQKTSPYTQEINEILNIVEMYLPHPIAISYKSEVMQHAI